MEISKYKSYPVLMNHVSYNGCGAKRAYSNILRIGQGSTDRKKIKALIEAFNEGQAESYERNFEDGVEFERICWAYVTGARLQKMLGQCSLKKI
jgi:hypothetical protein